MKNKSTREGYCTIYAKSHPDVRESVKLFYRDREVSKSAFDNRCDNEQDHAQICVNDCGKSTIRLNHKCATTNNTTIKDTTVKTIAPPAPCLPGGQAPTSLQHKKLMAESSISRFCRNFGKARTSLKLSEEEDERRRQQLQKQLAAMEK